MRALLVVTSLVVAVCLALAACTLALGVCEGNTPCVDCTTTDAGPTCAVIVNGNVPIQLGQAPPAAGDAGAP